MAKLVENHVVIKLSKLIKNNDKEEALITEEQKASLSELIEGLLDDQSIVIDVEDTE